MTWSNNVLCLLAASETKSRPGSLIQKGPHLDGRKILTELNPKQNCNNARSSWLGRQRRKTARGKSVPLKSIKTNALKLLDFGLLFFEKKKRTSLKHHFHAFCCNTELEKLCLDGKTRWLISLGSLVCTQPTGQSEE